METLFKILKSRTTWVFVLMFIIGGVEAVASFIPEGVRSPLMGFLGMLGMYFKMSPSQKY